MTTAVLLMFIPACFALNMIPGPNNLLSMANGRRYGVFTAIQAGLGRLLAFALMIVLVALGLSAVLLTSEWAFLSVKVLGSIYLMWVAVKLWRSDSLKLPEPKAQTNHSGHTNPSGQNNASAKTLGLVRQEFLLAAGNPKAILIFTSFLPQFVQPTAQAQQQLMILGIVYLLLELLAVAIYALMGAGLNQWLTNTKAIQWFNRTCATLLAASALRLVLQK